jgi:hypothetical protein
VLKSEVTEWFEKGFSELDFINHVRPVMMSSIASFARSYNKSSSLQAFLLEVNKAGATVQEYNMYEKLCKELYDLKLKYKEGDFYARAVLTNLRLVRPKKKKEEQ